MTEQPPSETVSAEDLDAAPLLLVVSPAGEVRFWLSDAVPAGDALNLLDGLAERIRQMPLPGQ